MSETLDLVVIGDTNLDLILKIGRFPAADDEVEAQETLSSPGGDAANTAVMAARLGLRTALISSIGSDENGRTVIKGMQSSGVDLSALQVSEGQSTGLVISEVTEDGQRAMIASRGANTNLQLDETHRPLFSTTRRVHVCDPQPQIVAALPALLEGSGAALSLDPGSISAAKGLDFLLPLLGICRILFVNRNELRLLSGVDDSTSAVQKLISLGIETVFLKCGAEGCRIFTQTRQLAVAALEVESIDSTGAGDAFDAAALFALSQGWRLEDVGRFANAVGALTTLGMGAQTSQPDLARVREFLS